MESILDNDISHTESKDCYILFYFTADWCGPCQKIKPLLIKLNEGLDSSDIEFYKVDIDNNDKLSEKYNIKSVPSFLLFKKGKLIDECSGADITKVHRLLKKNM